MTDHSSEIGIDVDVDRFLNAHNYQTLAETLGIDVKKLKYYIYNPKGRKYTEFRIPKKSGGKRIIHAPITALKILQTKLSEILYKIYRPRHAAKGFVIGESIVTNARVHVGRRVVFNIDIKDFFGLINFGRVYGLFQSAPFNFNKEVAACLGKMVCFAGKLPQGAPTSPIISNMICIRLDKELQIFARKNALLYTRYADDITFSTDLKSFSANVVVGSGRKVEVGEELLKIFSGNGFEINPLKSRVYYRHNRQMVTGLIVNKGVNVPRRYIRHLRGIIHSIQKHGLVNAQTQFELYYSKFKHKSKTIPLLVNYLQGKMAFLRQVKGKNDQVYDKLLRSLHDLFPVNFDAPFNEFERIKAEWNDLKTNPTGLTAQQRGFKLQDFFYSLFEYYNIPVLKSYKISATADQIDAGFKFDSRLYVVECKWTTKPAAGNALDRLNGVMSRLGAQVGGMFFSVNGWSKNVEEALARNPVKNTFLFNGDDVEDLLNKTVILPDLLRHKMDGLHFYALAYTRYSPPVKVKATRAIPVKTKKVTPAKKTKKAVTPKATVKSKKAVVAKGRPTPKKSIKRSSKK